MESKIYNKISVLREIRDAKNILFGAFSDKLTKERKVEEWKKILNKCQSLGLVPADKDYSYVRDTFWSNIKRATLAKRDNANKTGAAGGKNKKFTPVDDIVLEIIGKDSPIIEGIGAQDILDDAGKNENTPLPSEPIDDITCTPAFHDPDVNGLDPVASVSKKNTTAPRNKSLKFVTKGSKAFREMEEEKLVKKRKLELQVEFLELQNYKMKLEILELEKKLNVTSSKYTKDIKRNQIQENENTQSNTEQNVLLLTEDKIILNEDAKSI